MASSISLSKSLLRMDSLNIMPWYQPLWPRLWNRQLSRLILRRGWKRLNRSVYLAKQLELIKSLAVRCGLKMSSFYRLVPMKIASVMLVLLCSTRCRGRRMAKAWVCRWSSDQLMVLGPINRTNGKKIYVLVRIAKAREQILCLVWVI